MPDDRPSDLPTGPGGVGGGPAAAGEDGHLTQRPAEHCAGPAAGADVRRVHPVVSAAVSDGTRRVYGSYWNRIVEHWGQRRLDEPTPSDIERLAGHVPTHTGARPNAPGGRRRPPHPPPGPPPPDPHPPRRRPAP